HRLIYQAIKEISQYHFGAVSLLLRNAGLSRQAYYKFLKRKETASLQMNTGMKPFSKPPNFILFHLST
ncbi:hypothetical protein, partial [Pediococcus acidilactici]